MNGYLVTMVTDYPWFGWLLAVAAVFGLAYGSLWVAGLAAWAGNWIAYRRSVLASKMAVRRQLLNDPERDCAECNKRDVMVLEAMLAKLTEADGPDDPGWDEPGEDWSPALAWGPPPEMPAREPAEPGRLSEERCANRDCFRYGTHHSGPCDVAPTMPAACIPDDLPWECPKCHCLFEVPGFTHEPCWSEPLSAADMGLKDGPAMPPQPWPGYEASLETLYCGDHDLPIHPVVAAELGHDSTEAAVDSIYTRAMAAEVQAMVTDGIIGNDQEEAGK